MMPDDVTELMIPVRKTKTTWNQQNGVGAVSEEDDSRGEEMSREKNDLWF